MGYNLYKIIKFHNPTEIHKASRLYAKGLTTSLRGSRPLFDNIILFQTMVIHNINTAQTGVGVTIRSYMLNTLQVGTLPAIRMYLIYLQF